MNLLQRVGEWLAPKTERRGYLDLAQFALLGGTTYAGPQVSEESSLRASAVYACVRIISESLASLPLVVYRQRGREKERATNHPLYPVLHSLANGEMTSMEWRETAFSHVLLWGNHWSEKEFDSMGRLVGLWPLRPDKMEQLERRGSEAKWLYRLPSGEARWIPTWRLHHIRGLSIDGNFGLSPIATVARQAVGLSLATEEFGARFFSNGAHLNKMLRHPGKLSPEAYARLQASWAGDSQGLSNAHRTKILEEGMDVTTVGIPPNEAQFIETRKFQITEIARIFRVPPHMLADLDRATFSNIEQQSQDFVVNTLRPWIVRHEQAISRDLLTPTERRSLFPKYIVEGILRGDTLSRYQSYQIAVNNGMLTPNEIRELEDRDPMPNGDVLFMTLNSIELGAEPPAPAGAPAQEAEPPAEEEQDAAHVHAELRAEVSEPEPWDERAERIRADRQAIMRRTVRLFEDAAERVVKREVADIRKALKGKLGQRDAAGFETWLEGFYRDLRGWMPAYYQALMDTYAETILAAVAAEVGGKPRPLDDDLREWIAKYLENFTAVYAVGGEKQLRAIVADDEIEDKGAAIEERLAGWEANRAQKTALEQSFEAGNALAIVGYAFAGRKFLRWSARGESCPLCKKLDGRRIPIGGAFVDEGGTVEAEGVDPLPVVRKVRHGPLHQACDCVVVGG